MALTKVDVGTDEMDSEMEEWWERKDHPLLNDVILRNLFEFMRGKDLKACRLVSRKWCEFTLPFAHSEFEVTLRGSREEFSKKLTDFVEVFKQNKLGIPFVKYDLNSFCTTEGPGQEFLKICGNTVKTLSLSNDKSDVSTVKIENISEVLKAMPNIEDVYIFESSPSQSGQSGDVVKLFPDSSTKPTLKLLKTLALVDGDKTNKYCPTFFEEMLSIAPNITELEYTSHHPNINAVRQILEAIAKFERESVIRNIHFVTRRNEYLEILDREGEKENSLEFLPQLANLFKNSIESLYVDEVFPSFIQLPHMSKLESLKFYITKDFDSKSVKLNELFPSLKELWLFNAGNEVGYDEPELAEFLPNSDSCPNVKSFYLNIHTNIQVFDHILNIFPKLTKLDLCVKPDGAQIIRRIMTEMTQLQDLSIQGPRPIEIDSIDALLTGIPVHKVKELEHVVLEFSEMTDQLRLENIRHYRDRYYQFPSIENLTNLKRLRLKITGTGNEGDHGLRIGTRMTDVFLYFGLYSMKHINKLVIERCEFTKKSREILKAEMALEFWVIECWDPLY